MRTVFVYGSETDIVTPPFLEITLLVLALHCNYVFETSDTLSYINIDITIANIKIHIYFAKVQKTRESKRKQSLRIQSLKIT
jgi:hypothetical protein